MSAVCQEFLVNFEDSHLGGELARGCTNKLCTLEFPGKQKSSNSASQNSAQRACTSSSLRRQNYFPSNVIFGALKMRGANKNSATSVHVPQKMKFFDEAHKAILCFDDFAVGSSRCTKMPRVLHSKIFIFFVETISNHQKIMS